MQSAPTWNQTQSKPSSPIDKCENLILETFIQIMCDGDHSRLGEGDTADAWGKIRQEYEELTGGSGYKETIMLIRDIAFTDAKINIVQTTVDAMSKYYLPGFGEVLKKYGISYNWEGLDDETYFAQLNKVLNQTKTWVVQLAALKRELDALNKKAEGKPIDRTYFEDWLIMLSKEQGYAIKSTETSTYQFALLIKRTMSKSQKGAKK